MSAAWAMQRAVYQALVADAALAALLGGPQVFDDVPRDAEFPYVALGPNSVRDWSTGTDDGHEHGLVLHVWSRAAGRKQAHEIMGAIEVALDEAELTPEGHRLINIRHDSSETRREGDDDAVHGVVRFRAVTEPVG